MHKCAIIGKKYMGNSVTLAPRLELKYVKWCIMRQNSLQARLVVMSTLIVVFVVLLTSLTQYIFTRTVVLDNAYNNAADLINQLSLNLGTQLIRFEKIHFDEIYYNQIVPDLANSAEKGQDQLYLERRVKQYLEYYITLPMVKWSIIITNDNLVYEPNRFIEEDETQQSLVHYFDKEKSKLESGKPYWHITEDGRLIMQRKLINPENHYLPVATSITEVDLDELIKNLNMPKLLSAAEIFLLDTNKRHSFLLHEVDEDVKAMIENEYSLSDSTQMVQEINDYLVAKSVVKKSALYLYIAIDKNTLMLNYQQLFPFLFVTCAVGLFVAFVLIRYATSVMMRHMQDFILHLRSYSVEHPKMVDIPKHQDEITEIMKEFNLMNTKNIMLLVDLLESEREKNDIELSALRFEYNALQTQVNPHFIYNTLESISSMASLNGCGDVSEAACTLGELLRACTDHSGQLITLQQEVFYVEKYLSIENLNYGNRLDVNIQIPQKLKNTLVPRWIIQPLVENAIKHGVSKLDKKGEIEISANQYADVLAICVKDNGPGIDKKVFSRFLSEQSSEKESNHIGINSVHKRIQIMYGKQYGLSIKSAENQGTSVVLQMPVQKRKDF